jgi:hypothetical protein
VSTVDSLTPAQLAALLRDCLQQGQAVELEWIGRFRPTGEGHFEFQPSGKPTVFLAYVVEDADVVERLYTRLAAAGFDPWLDRRKLLPGQNWPRAIERAIRASDFFVACLSKKAVVKRGAFQAEMRYALDCARQVPFDDIFFVPVRLDDCRVPARIQQQIQYIDLFPDFHKGAVNLISTLKTEVRRREER